MSDLSTDLISMPSLATAPSGALAKVAERLPEISQKVKVFGRSNSQASLGLMSLTMLTGQSPHRQVRQILAEIDTRRGALSEAQVSYAKLITEEPDESLPEPVRIAEERHNAFNLERLENLISGAVKDLAVLVDAYDSMTAKYGMENWSEADFEAAESRHHVRRGFELLYKDVVTTGRAKEATVEYLQQFGVHIQIALKEVLGYTAVIEEGIAAGERPSSASIENFLDAMADKYQHLTAEVTQRMFGKDQVWNSSYTQGEE